MFPLPFVSGTSTASAATTLTHVAKLGAYPDNFFIGAWLYLPDATVKDRRITDSAQSTGQTTFIPSDSGSLNGTDAYEVLPFSGTAIHQALEWAIKTAYDRGWVARESWLSHWLTGSPIYNSTFGYWTSSSAVDGWTASTVTLTRERHTGSNLVLPGEDAVKFSNATGTFELDVQFRRFLSDFRNHTVTLYAWLYSDTASKVRAQLLADGSVVGSTDYHSGGSTWEMVSSSALAISASATNVSVRIDLTSGTANNRAGAIWLESGPSVREYPFPIGLMPDGPTEIYLAPADVRSDDLVGAVKHSRLRLLSDWGLYRYRNEQENEEIGVLTFEKRPADGSKLLLPGRSPLSIPSSDSDYVEVGASGDDILLAKMAALHLVEAEGWIDDAAHQAFVSRLQRDIDGLSRVRGSRDSGAVALGPNW